MAAGQKEGVTVGARGLKAAEIALRPRALGEFPWSKVLIYNLAHDLLHNLARNPVCNPACNSAEGGYGRVVVIMW